MKFIFFLSFGLFLPSQSITAKAIESVSNPYPHPQHWGAYCSSDLWFLSCFKKGAVERVEEQCKPLNGLTYGQVIFALNQTLQQHEDIR
jgi:hypothetical protein